MVIQRQVVVPTQLLIAGISELAGKLLFMAGFNKLKQKQGDFCQPGSLCLLQAGQGAATLQPQQSEGIDPDPHPQAPTILQWKLKLGSICPKHLTSEFSPPSSKLCATFPSKRMTTLQGWHY